MQECYYELTVVKGRASIVEVVSDRNTKGEKLKGYFFKKTFTHLGERNLFEASANLEISLISTRVNEKCVIDSFISNCTSTPDSFGY